MAVFNKQKIRVGVQNHSKIDLSSTHITTNNFMQLGVANYRHMMPGEHYKGKCNVVSRLAPVQVPTYGRCRINMRSFFVPFEFVMPQFNQMITDTIGSNFGNSALVTSSPQFTIDKLWDMFLNYEYAGTYDLMVDSGTSAKYDFELDGTYYNLTYYGRRFYKILQSLGYQVIPFDKNDASPFSVSALPLLCLAKVYVDYYWNHAYANNQSILSLQQLFSYNDPTSFLSLDTSDIGDLLSTISIVCYDNGNDVYINAWDTPVSPNTGNYSSLSVNDQTTLNQGSSSINTRISNYVSQGSNGTPTMFQTSASNTAIGTQYMHDMLTSLTDYFKRNQLSGSYAAERFLSRYGLSLDNQVTKRAYYISSASVDVDFGSVMQTADTSSAGEPSNLGDYAGVGFGKGVLDIDFEADTFGLLLVTYSIVPSSSIYQGLDRNLLHLTKEQFFTPEFDNLGCAAIAKGEVYVSRRRSFCFTSPSDYLGVFGFAPNYYEYKQARDFVTGDFVLDSAMVGGDAWFLNRKFNDNNFAGSNINGLVHSSSFTVGVDKEQYDRIFQYVDVDIDKFYLVFHTDAMSLAPCKSVFDSYDFDSLGKVIEQNGNSAPVN